MIKYDELQRLRNSKDPDERRICIKLLNNHLLEKPKDAEAWFDLASCHDFLGEAALALPAYEKCQSIGSHLLPGEKQPRFFIQYGSTLRNNKKLSESKKILLEGIQKFPEVRSMKMFLAFTLHGLGEFQESSRLLLKTCAQLPIGQFEGYENAIQWYSENLDAQ